MNRKKVMMKLAENMPVFEALLKEGDAELIQWRPQPDKWNLLEIVCHLYDEEREDFRARLKHVLETPDLPMPGINPPLWVTERKYSERNYSEMVARFLEERESTIKWLSTLDNSPWDNIHLHPQIGKTRPDFILNNWLAHDYLHMRQIMKLRYDRLARERHSLKYAGDW